MILVTGGAGFIGSNIVKAYNNAGMTDIIVVDDMTDSRKVVNLNDLIIADYYDYAELEKLIEAGRFDLPLTGISHQGACSDTMEHDGRYMMRNNFTYSKMLFEFATQRKISFVYASSAATYGNSQTFTEDPANEQPLNVYGYSKLAFDQFVRHQMDNIQSTVVGLRYFNVFGPREYHKGRMASIVFQLKNQLKKEGHVTLFAGTQGYGDGEQQRDFVYVGDVCKVNRFFLEADKPHKGIYNCGTGKAHSFNDVANALIKIKGTGSIRYKPFPKELQGKYQAFTQADLTNLQAAGYNQPFTHLETAIAETLEWYEQRQL